jgi:predicted RNA-binding protein with EMAP domain
MEIGRQNASAEDAADLLNHIAGVLEGLRKIADAGQLDRVVQAIDTVFGEIVSIAMAREGEGPAATE